MSTPHYTEEELRNYFQDSAQRHRNGQSGKSRKPSGNGRSKQYRGYRGSLHQYFQNPPLAEAVFFLSSLAMAGLMMVGLLVGFMLALGGDMPSVKELENPNLQLATVAYTADGVELGRFGRQNRSRISYSEISPHVVDALVSTEDHRFYSHWGVDVFRTVSSAVKSAFSLIGLGIVQGGSTITQQLARNLYNEQIGFDRSPIRKLKEMVTAVKLERRYTKQEIIEMYLNTVPYGYNAYGIEAAARTYFGKSAAELDVLESATLVGMLQAITRYNPVRNPDWSRQRRNLVMRQMIKHDRLDQAFYEEYKDQVTPTKFRSAEVTDSFAPYFAEHVRNWLADWGKENGHDIYAEGLVVYTTLDSRLQEFASEALKTQMTGLQAVVDWEWGRASNYHLGQTIEVYLEKENKAPFAYFWESQTDLVDSFIKESSAFKALRKSGVARDAAVKQLRENTAFIDSLRAEKTRLEAGLVSIDPHTGHIKAWVGGRDLRTDWFDHVDKAKRQPGSTFKPFVYTAAIDNGYSPEYMLPDTQFVYIDPRTKQRWSPGNSGEPISGRMMTLREGLARSLNTITAQLIIEIEPGTAAFYARRMGIKSELYPVPALALGTSDVTLLEMSAAYSTLANGGLRQDPIAVTRIEDKNGRVLYEAESKPEEALSEQTAFTVIDMMRDVVDYGTAVRFRRQFDLYGYDFAGKTGTTQESADGWFMLLHPQLVTGSWVGFNDRRITFRSNWWGQGGHNALFIVGDFIKRASSLSEEEGGLRKDERFPMPHDYAIPVVNPEDTPRERPQEERPRVGW